MESIIKNIDYEYIENQSISLTHSTVISILGPSKSGKTNMLKNICQMFIPLLRITAVFTTICVSTTTLRLI